MNKVSAPSVSSLLVELGCEELPPKSLQRLARSFYDSVCKGLIDAGFEINSNKGDVFYTPRRLAFRIDNVSAKQADQVLDRRGPALSAAYDTDGKPTRAALGFARSVGLELDEIERQKTDKGEWLFCQINQPGKALVEVLYPVMEKALATLPVSKPMRWSAHDFSFVRPVHWLIVLHGSEVLEGELFGKKADRLTLGHRIHSPGPHPIDTPETYEAVLESAFVMVDPSVRKKKIKELVVTAGQELGGNTRITDSLLDEVTNIVEWPVALSCSFEDVFLEVPHEALIASMEDHQKFFPVLHTDTDKLTSGFVVITNIESKNQALVIEGFERVIRPRLADARFFWDRDQKISLDSYCDSLNAVVFQKNLGSLGDKSRRIAALSGAFADFTGKDSVSAQRAGLLSKCDLVTQMVGEFPGLQGTMGAYYARLSNESPEVAQAIGEHYFPRFAGDAIPTSDLGRILSVADRMDTLVGIFALGLKPSGSRDPFALRRAALGVVRIITEAEIPVSIDQLLNMSISTLSGQITIPDQCRSDVQDFLLERLRNYYLEQGFNTNVVNAVFAAPLTTLDDLRARLNALAQFLTLPVAQRLVTTHKRIGNILRKSEIVVSREIDEDLLSIDEERTLFEEVIRFETALNPLFKKAEYDTALEKLASLDPIIAAFFDAVMVMDDDPLVRNNRLALLARLKGLFDTVADLTKAT